MLQFLKDSYWPPVVALIFKLTVYMHTMFFKKKYQIDALQILISKTSDFMIHSSEIQGHGNIWMSSPAYHN